VVVLVDRRQREVGVGWCWVAERGGVRFELLIPDGVLELLSSHGLSPFQPEHDGRAGFYEKLETSTRRKLLSSTIGQDRRVILHENDLALG
jgi:hypothetical protein